MIGPIYELSSWFFESCTMISISSFIPFSPCLLLLFIDLRSFCIHRSYQAHYHFAWNTRHSKQLFVFISHNMCNERFCIAVPLTPSFYCYFLSLSLPAALLLPCYSPLLPLPSSIYFCILIFVFSCKIFLMFCLMWFASANVIRAFLVAFFRLLLQTGLMFYSHTFH